MKSKAHEVIEKINELKELNSDDKNAMIDKINEWKSDSSAESNTLAVTFEKFWIQLEPIFSEMGWI